MLFLTVLLSGLLQLVSHLATKLYAPKLPIIPRYIIGTLALLIPPTMFYGLDDALPFWAAAVASGAAVVGATWIGEKVNDLRDRLDAGERAMLTPSDAQRLMEGVRHAKTEKRG